MVKHPFIVKLFYAFETEDCFYLGLEYMGGGDLFNYLEKIHVLPEDRACLYTAEVILAVKYLHENNIVYRDLKPNNILLDAQGHVKLSDFGLCKRLHPDKNRAYTFCGTLDYMSPEMVQKRVYNEAVDWWSVGVLLYDMLTGCTPFTILNDRNMTIQNIKFGKFSFKKTKVIVTPVAKDLICKLLKLAIPLYYQIQPKERLGSGPSGTKELMSHPFFKNINWENLLFRKLEPLINRIDENVKFEEIFENIFEHRF
ncbi:PREDICTED: ribosomal protein S6 kinase beta-1-like [Ceratosolen solmsi marchali]|uniref:Ribosomal protein S6 kinase beta-1-like n=1 Tax=Ceratosolen solmsi marchali TaxID=326594 RepID=A0AAJ6VJT2_9HYME|nr:PREDICTED: ribosomal protein S6 kinase beta-1-like [Ceratosolen solmsi marchali]